MRATLYTACCRLFLALGTALSIRWFIGVVRLVRNVEVAERSRAFCGISKGSGASDVRFRTGSRWVGSRSFGGSCGFGLFLHHACRLLGVLVEMHGGVIGYGVLQNFFCPVVKFLQRVAEDLHGAFLLCAGVVELGAVFHGSG